MLAILLLAIALSMDAFAVSIGLGAKHRRHALKLALMAAAYFGISQGVMPLIGYLGGRTVLGFIENLAPWIACIILLGLGGKMLYEALANDEADEPIGHNFEIANDPKLVITPKTMMSLAIATSIDAMAAGFTLTLIPINPYLACSIIAVITAIFSFIGVWLGNKSGTWLESKAEVFGGIVLILIGIKMIVPLN